MISVYCDGGARPNPGKAGIGFLFHRGKKIILDGYQYIGDKITNNQAEFIAVINSLTTLYTALPNEKKVKLFTDSRLVANSFPTKDIRSRFVLKEEKLVVLYNILVKLLEKFENVEVIQIPREKNKLADKLVQIAINTRQTKILQYSP